MACLFGHFGGLWGKGQHLSSFIQHMPCATHRHPHNDGNDDAADHELLQSSDDEGAGKDVQAVGVEDVASLPASLPHWPKDMELGATGLQSQTKLYNSIQDTPTVILDLFLV